MQREQRSPEARVAALERRLAAVEKSVGLTGSGGRRKKAKAKVGRELLRSLSESASKPREGRSGEVVYGGSCRLGEAEYLYAREHRLEDVLAVDREGAGRVLASLGNPARLELVLALLEAPRSAQELGALLSEGSTGQLYHHLRELQSVGLLLQPKRGVYGLAPNAAVPLLVVLAAAIDAGSADAGIREEVRA